MIAVTMVLAIANHRLAESTFDLPPQLRLSSASLSDLPLEIGDVRSCPCWQGPRDLGQRKYKFSITNRSTQSVNIGGGVDSGIRLLIAYSVEVPEEILLPANSRGASLSSVDPPGIDFFEAAELEPFTPELVIDSRGIFGVPTGYQIFAFPAMPNLIVESAPNRSGDGSYASSTFATVVERPQLLPDTRFFDDRRGHGTWNFLFPTSDLIRAIYPPLGSGPYMVPSMRRESFEDELIFVGIAIFSSDGEILGFAPSPTEAAWSDPSSL
ncbi:MAG: hypothetical protein ACK5OX_06945 [Desertimonas sp.]